MSDFTLHQGHALDVLRTMPDASVQCSITSPPYYGLRSYRTEPQIWDGDAGCGHEWGDDFVRSCRGSIHGSTLDGGVTTQRSQGEIVGNGIVQSQGNCCRLCNAWRGELGLEPTFQMYLSHLLQIFAEVKRVVKDDGTIFVNLGDSYSGDSPVRETSREAFSETWDTSQTRTNGGNRRSQICSVPRKSLLNIPHRFFIAMTDELKLIQRNNINWWKRACMPSSAKDRFTVDFESIGFFTKQAKYKFNQVLEPLAESTVTDPRTIAGEWSNARPERGYNGAQQQATGMLKPTAEGMRNARTTWDFAFEPSSNEHYAAYPSKMCDRMILAGSDEGDTVLDIFNGTASTGLSALRLKRNYIGIELNESYIEISKRRLAEIQVNLF